MATDSRFMTLDINGKELKVIDRGMYGYSVPEYHQIEVGEWGVVWGE